VAEAAHSIYAPISGGTLRKRGLIKTERSRGAVAVEFALVAPVLLLLLAGIVEFAHAFNIQISVTQAAREAARNFAITNDLTKASAAGKAGAPGLTPSKFTFSPSIPACEPGKTITITVQYAAESVTGFALVMHGQSVAVADTFTSTGIGAMRCGG
jgi:Flp pilus assembly protein TadG